MSVKRSRDALLTVGNEILEAKMSHRSRWFEYLCYIRWLPMTMGFVGSDSIFPITAVLLQPLAEYELPGYRSEYRMCRGQ